MKTEKEIKESIEWLRIQIDRSLTASELGEDITGKGTELPKILMNAYTTQKQTLEWVLDDGEERI